MSIQAQRYGERVAPAIPLTRSQKACGKARSSWRACRNAMMRGPASGRACDIDGIRSTGRRAYARSVVAIAPRYAPGRVQRCFRVNTCREATRLSARGDSARFIADQWLKARFDFVLCASNDKHLTYDASPGRWHVARKLLFSNDRRRHPRLPSSVGTGLAMQAAGDADKTP